MRVFRERIFRLEHPDGGVFNIFPAKGDEARELDDLVTTEYVTDSKGQLVYNQKTGNPVAKTKRNLDAIIESAARKVHSFENVTEVLADGTTVPMASTRENIEFLLRNYVGTTEREFSVTVLDGEGKPVIEDGETKKRKEMREVPHPLYLWVAENVQRVTLQLREEQRKN